jgi:hypothetical protein
MRTESEIGAPAMIVVSWLAAAGALPLVLLTSVAGQGLGAVLGGCTWVGISLPIDRQVWALVNQPLLNFASLPRAFGYWWGSWLLPLAVALVITSLRPRSRSWTMELLILHVAWAAAAIAGAWLPLLDPDDGHLVRWLALHRLPPAAVWAAPLVGATVGLVPTLRVLELARRRGPQLGRTRRMSLVIIHLGAPAVAWAGLVAAVAGEPLVRATAGLAAPVAGALILAWFRFPGPAVHRVQPPTARNVAVLLLGIVLGGAAVWCAGRPLGDGRAAGLLWGKPGAFNNIRTWIEPTMMPGTR